MREIGSALYAFMDKYLSWIDKPKIGPTDIIEIIIIAFVLYHVMAVSYTHLTLPTTSRV